MRRQRCLNLSTEVNQTGLLAGRVKAKPESVAASSSCRLRDPNLDTVNELQTVRERSSEVR